jgi:hypothetical protein
LVFDQFISKYAASFNLSANTTFDSNPRQACNGRNFSEAMDEEPGLVKRQP